MEWQRGILRGHLHETMGSICNVSRRQQHLQDVLVDLVIGWDEQMWNGGRARWAAEPLVYGPCQAGIRSVNFLGTSPRPDYSVIPECFTVSPSPSSFFSETPGQ